MSSSDPARAAAGLLTERWAQALHGDDLPASCRPLDRAQGYQAQTQWPQIVSDDIAGWKIAATSVAGQQHIGVSGPLAGPVFRRRVVADGAQIPLAGNSMRVAECEVVFRIDHTLAPRASRYSRAEVLAAVGALMPGIEVPDSRFGAFERAGEAQLIADCACCHDMVLGKPVAPDERVASLPALQVQARVSDGREPAGLGRNVLGDPVEALVWLVNEVTGSGRRLEAGQFVTTGALVPPIPVVPGLQVLADFGWIGTISVRFT